MDIEVLDNITEQNIQDINNQLKSQASRVVKFVTKKEKIIDAVLATYQDPETNTINILDRFAPFLEQHMRGFFNSQLQEKENFYTYKGSIKFINN